MKGIYNVDHPIEADRVYHFLKRFVTRRQDTINVTAVMTQSLHSG